MTVSAQLDGKLKATDDAFFEALLALDGTRIEASSRYTHVFRLSGDRWQLFSAQGTPIVDDAAAQAKASQEPATP